MCHKWGDPHVYIIKAKTPKNGNTTENNKIDYY